MRTIEYNCDLCVVGAGISGICAAISAARHGLSVVVIHDRPMPGGNASSEVRMWICGSHGKDNRETGIVEEMILENYYKNPRLNYPQWDGVMFGLLRYQEGITLLLNSSVLDGVCEDGVIRSVTAWQSNAETFHKVSAKYFSDCSGDSILAPISGASYRHGREAKSEYNETIPPDVADSHTMGMSCLMQLRETENEVRFTPPEWAYKFTKEDLPDITFDGYDNFWWIETGGLMDTVHDTDKCRDELLKIAYGVFDYMKNDPDLYVKNWDIDWIGFLPGKRESRRYIGEYVVTQNDVEAEGRFDDIVAYAGWRMDDHFPEGFYYRGHPTIYHPAPTPWGLPLRCMISKDIKNLVFAGRNISVTHAALSSSRVMATCGVLGQAIGTAVAQAVNDGVDVRAVDIHKLQQTLMEDDCYIPWHEREAKTLGVCSAPVLTNGRDRGDGNFYEGELLKPIAFTFDGDTEVKSIRLVLDSDINRKVDRMVMNMPCSYPLKPKEWGTPKTLLRDFDIVGTDSAGNEYTLCVTDCHQRFVNLEFEHTVCRLELIPKTTWGADTARIFSFEVR